MKILIIGVLGGVAVSIAIFFYTIYQVLTQTENIEMYGGGDTLIPDTTTTTHTTDETTTTKTTTPQ